MDYRVEKPVNIGDQDHANDSQDESNKGYPRQLVRRQPYDARNEARKTEKHQSEALYR